MVPKNEYRRIGRTSAALLAGLMLTSLSASLPAKAQGSTDYQARLQRLERDMRDLQAETFKRTPGRTGAAAPAGGKGAVAAAPAPEPPPVVQPATPPAQAPDLDPLMRRINEMEESIGRLTGQMEELGHQIDLLSQKTDRLQKQMDFEAKQRADAAIAGAPAADAGATAATPPGDAVASVAPDTNAPILRPLPPAPGTLGQIPADTKLPTPRTAQPASTPAPPAAAAGDPKREFDTAMNLLSRGQYDQASHAFRTFADAHPDDDRASAALYWTGDIAYSSKKDYDEAARDFAELLKKYPKSPRAPDSMLKLGQSLFELGQMKEGCAALAALPAKYPEASPQIATTARNERRDNKCR